jgi:glc operon protein GlcG
MKRSTLQLAACALLAAAPISTAHAQAAYGKGLTLEMANKCLAASQAEARKNNWNMALSVVDDGGHLVAFARMDNTQIASVRISMEKARAANNFRRPTKAFQDRVASGDVAVLGLPGAITSEGGAPLLFDGKIVGAIGASGGTAQQDGQVAKACADALAK